MLHVITGAGESPAYPIVRKIGFADLKDAVAKGIDDFSAVPTHVIFLAIIYPLVGLFLARMTFGYDVVPLLFPLAAGYALIGPFAAIGLYELSRQRERGVEVSWKHAFGLLRCPSLDAIPALGVVLVIGALPFFVGLAVVMPVLAHSTWHLYRKVVEPDLSP